MKTAGERYRDSLREWVCQSESWRRMEPDRPFEWHFFGVFYVCSAVSETVSTLLLAARFCMRKRRLACWHVQWTDCLQKVDFDVTIVTVITLCSVTAVVGIVCCLSEKKNRWYFFYYEGGVFYSVTMNETYRYGVTPFVRTIQELSFEISLEPVAGRYTADFTDVNEWLLLKCARKKDANNVG